MATSDTSKLSAIVFKAILLTRTITLRHKRNFKKKKVSLSRQVTGKVVEKIHLREYKRPTAKHKQALTRILES